MEDAQARLHAKAEAVGRRLAAAYGQPALRPHRDAVGELVSTILSQNTNDRNRDVAYTQLCARLPRWEQVRDADAWTVMEAIRPAGLAGHKGPAIQEALQTITRERGELSLDFLAAWPVPEAKAWLMQMKGVGPKTAAIVLLFALGRPAFPVDTHVHRVCRRLGLIGPTLGREAAHDEMEALVEPAEYYAFHLNLIRHGREVCHSRVPRCEGCPLAEVCDDWQGRREQG